jgi:hypothetical protein
LNPVALDEAKKAKLGRLLTLWRSRTGTPSWRDGSYAIVKGGGAAPKGFTAIRELGQAKAGEEALLPYFVPQTALPALESAIAKAYADGVRVFRIASFFEFALFKRYKDVVLKSCFPLPCANSFAAEEIVSLGAKEVQAWLELEQTAFEELAAHSTAPLELYIYGRPPLLSTRAKLPIEGMMADARGNKFRIAKKGLLSLVYAEKVMELPELPGFSRLVDLREAAPDEEGTSCFNFKHVLS